MKVCVIFGFGPGVSDAVLQRFGESGEFKIALVARNQGRLSTTADAWTSKGVTVKGFAADLSKPGEVPCLIESIEADLGPIDVAM